MLIAMASRYGDSLPVDERVRNEARQIASYSAPARAAIGAMIDAALASGETASA